ncbi:acyl-CoA dehydrogenase [Sphingobium sp. CR28]|uniref:acyl-CoA dehydrogenase n=1 Tax=Sphingobium sp. CR28 TaxID=3400272 RepID=UPI003FEEF413
MAGRGDIEMADYRAPIAEQMFVLGAVADLPGLSGLPGFEVAGLDTAEAILGESARLAEAVFAPLNRSGDREGARWQNGTVTLPKGFREAYRDYAAGGWLGLSAHPDHGGQGLPFVLCAAVQEQLTAANMALSLNPMLTLGAIEALQAHGTAEQQALYLSRIVSGEWTATMNLTEPQAGSDLGALRSTAVPAGDGSYRIAGQKIFITWGEHDVADNIVHLVLARLPDAPAGPKGISLFLVSKFLPDESGHLAKRNDVQCVSIEHKLGIHASPTCTMQYGEKGACVGWLVGAEHGGLAAMFTMMNHARINVGLQGVAIAERARQDAYAYAAERIQFGPIIEHPDVRRMLMTMTAETQAARAIVYMNAAAVDHAHAEPDADIRARWKRRADLLTPISKAYGTDVGVLVTSLAVQVHGGMGYIEETGVAQHYRDARIAPIYEGTNGIQAMDLAGRKLRGDGGAAMAELQADIAEEISQWRNDTRRATMEQALSLLAEAASQMRAHDQAGAGAAAYPFLNLCAGVIGGWLLGRQAERAEEMKASGEGDHAALAAKSSVSDFFLSQRLPLALANIAAIRCPAEMLAV